MMTIAFTVLAILSVLVLFINFIFVIPSKGQSAYLGGWYFLLIEAGFILLAYLIYINPFWLLVWFT
jgi:hypothetical protein